MHDRQKTLLKKFLDRTCDDKELQEVKALLREPAANEFLEELMGAQAEKVEEEYWEKGEQLTEKTEGWLKQVNQQIHRKKRSFYHYAAVWAGILIVCSLAYWQLNFGGQFSDQSNYIEIVNEIGVPERFILPDSSVIYLGASSSIKYPEGFKGDLREVQLSGEAFFEIKHMPQRPFIVHAGDVRTQVLGTSFKVQAFKEQPLIVSVATGRVGVSKVGAVNPRLLAMLTPGVRVTYYNGRDEVIKDEVMIDDLLGWKKGDIVFEEQSLQSVVAELERRFGFKITFGDENLKAYQVSGSFPSNQSLETDLKILSIIAKFKYRAIDNSSFLIEKPNNM